MPFDDDNPNVKPDAMSMLDCPGLGTMMYASPINGCVATAVTVERGGHRDVGGSGRVDGQKIMEAKV